MRSLNNAICTSGDPVSFGCTRYCSITTAFTSLNSSSPSESPCPALLFLPLLRLKMLAHYLHVCHKRFTFSGRRRSMPARRIRLLFGALHQREELVARLFVVAKRAEHRARYRKRILFFDSAHHHAEVPCLDNHSHSLRVQLFLYGVRDLIGEPF